VKGAQVVALSGELALVAAALFTGAAIYVIACEQPARLALDDRALLAEFKPSYKNGTLMQAPLALLGCVLGLIAWWQVGNWRWLAGAIAILSPWPWTLFIIRPINSELLNTDLTNAGPQTRALIVKWGLLHLGRVTFGAAATLLFLLANRT